MIIDTPDGPKFEWEVDAETVAVALAATESAALASEQRAGERRLERERVAREAEEVATATATSKSGIGELTSSRKGERQTGQCTGPAVAQAADPSLVPMAQRGNAEGLRERLATGCTPNVFAFEFDLYPGSKRMFCNDWTPLTAAAAAGEAAAVAALLAARADPDVLCCSSTSSGLYKCWTALDCARTGGTVPFERDHAKHEQPRHPAVEALLLEAGARPSSALPEPRAVNTYGLPREVGQRQNPCLDPATGMPLRPEHLYDPEEEEERKRVPGAPKLGRGGSGCPMTSIGMDIADLEARRAQAARDRVYTGGCSVYAS